MRTILLARKEMHKSDFEDFVKHADLDSLKSSDVLMPLL
jgi:hypothetical protein